MRVCDGRQAWHQRSSWLRPLGPRALLAYHGWLGQHETDKTDNPSSELDSIILKVWQICFSYVCIEAEWNRSKCCRFLINPREEVCPVSQTRRRRWCFRFLRLTSISVTPSSVRIPFMLSASLALWYFSFGESRCGPSQCQVGQCKHTRGRERRLTPQTPDRGGAWHFMDPNNLKRCPEYPWSRAGAVRCSLVRACSRQILSKRLRQPLS